VIVRRDNILREPDAYLVPLGSGVPEDVGTILSNVRRELTLKALETPPAQNVRRELTLTARSTSVSACVPISK